MIYKFKYVLSDKDYFEFNKYHMNNAPSNKKAINVLRLFVPIMFIVFLLLSFKSYEDSTKLVTTIILYTIVSVVWFFASKVFLVLFMKISFKMIKKDGKLPYGKDALIEFDENFLIETTSDTESKIKYTSIEKIAINNNSIYLYFSAIQAFLIPFSVFETEEQKDEFLAFINRKSATVE